MNFHAITGLDDLKVGDEVRFDHFGGTRRPGKVVKITKTAAHIEWTAPASGITRVVPVSFKPYNVVTGACEAVNQKNIQVARPKPAAEWDGVGPDPLAVPPSGHSGLSGNV